MPSLITAASAILASAAARFAGDPDEPAQWQLVTNSEMALDLDAFSDGACAGLGFVIVGGANQELGTSQLYLEGDGQLYTRMQVGIGVLRCAPHMGDDLRSPDPAEHLAYSTQVLNDAERLMKVVWDISRYSWITQEDITAEPPWAPIDIQGAAGGGAVTLELAVIIDC